MEYAVVRVVHNSNGYVKPSGGKLGRRTESSYARESGFGHEEWNFNKALLIDGRVHGYHYYNPAQAKREQPYTLFFVTYTNRCWHLVGAYRDAKYTAKGAPPSSSVNGKKLAHLRSLGTELGESWAELSDKQILMKLRDSESMRWSVRPQDIVVAPTEVAIPIGLKFDKEFRKNFHESSATLISSFDARRLMSLIGTQHPEDVITDLGGALTDPDLGGVEGTRKLVLHLKRERNRRLVEEKKAEVFRQTGRLACEVCTFDFSAFYGSHGQDFCEVHHLKRLADIEGRTVLTKLKDLAIVCSNCHRMLHKGTPMLTLQKLMAKIPKKTMALH